MLFLVLAFWGLAFTFFALSANSFALRERNILPLRLFLLTLLTHTLLFPLPLQLYTPLAQHSCHALRTAILRTQALPDLFHSTHLLPIQVTPDLTLLRLRSLSQSQDVL